MKIGHWKISPQLFLRSTLKDKFEYHQPVQIVGAVANSDGLRYLCIKNKGRAIGYAQFNWFEPHKFQCFAEGMTLESIKENADGNNYYWIHENDIRIYDSTYNKSNSKMSAMVLTRFKEDDE
jgi:hypothetical protein